MCRCIIAAVGSRVFALSIHADYACRRSGACCTAGWSIPVEPRIRPTLGADLLLPNGDGACPEFDRPSGLCRVHRDYGAAMLPTACAQFPRRTLRDDRGTFVTLSHFCPTAAAALVADGPALHIVENPAAFPATRDYDPLDAAGSWPPLLRPDVLFDLTSYSRWERFLVDTLAIDGPPADALWTIAHAAERLRAWTADRGPLAAYAEAVLSNRQPSGITAIYTPFTRTSAYEHVTAAVPRTLPRPVRPADADALWQQYVEPQWHAWSTPLRRYLAAKAFGSWSAYQSRGIRTHVAELMVAECLVRVEAARACGAARRRLDRALLLEAFRQADRLFMHLVEREELMRWLGTIER